jgi:hypothetical protein
MDENRREVLDEIYRGFRVNLSRISPTKRELYIEVAGKSLPITPSEARELAETLIRLADEEEEARSSN